MRYEEPIIGAAKALAILALAFLVLYSPWSLGKRELFSQEGKFAAIAMEMDLLKPSTVAHGETLSYYYPLHQWLTAMLYKAGMGVELGTEDRLCPLAGGAGPGRLRDGTQGRQHPVGSCGLRLCRVDDAGLGESPSTAILTLLACC